MTCCPLIKNDSKIHFTNLQLTIKWESQTMRLSFQCIVDPIATTVHSDRIRDTYISPWLMTSLNQRRCNVPLARVKATSKRLRVAERTREWRLREINSPVYGVLRVSVLLCVSYVRDSNVEFCFMPLVHLRRNWKTSSNECILLWWLSFELRVIIVIIEKFVERNFTLRFFAIKLIRSFEQKVQRMYIYIIYIFIHIYQYINIGLLLIYIR